MPNVTKRLVDSLEPQEKDYVIWDDKIKGFGIKVTPKGRKVYIFKYRNKANVQHKPAIGKHGNITCEQAREIAQKWSFSISQDNDPMVERHKAKESPKMQEICDRFLKEHSEVKKKPTSIAMDNILIEKFIKPKIGNLKVAVVTKNDIAELHSSMKDTPIQANRTVGLLSKIFNLAETWGFRPEFSNPTRGIQKYPEKSRERFLDTKEVNTLLDVLAKAEKNESESKHVIALFKLLLLTGARLREIKDAKWEWVDIKNKKLILPDSKTGKRVIQLSDSAIKVLKKIPIKKNNPYLIVGEVEGQHLINARKPWIRICKAAKLENVRIHDLRHTYAAMCIESGLSLYSTGKLLGHSRARTTDRYAHLAEDPLRLAAEQVGKKFKGIK
ncbi:MAG: DUF4102 domain-containing protein [Proteobacteria bacterium]|nr:DUF4102 domain-containing protein [Pseudomonadota bacterium]